MGNKGIKTDDNQTMEKTKEQSLSRPKCKEKSGKKMELWRAVKFLLFSISAGVIQMGLSAIFEIFTDNWWLVYLIPLVASVLWNFTFNRKFTFKSASNVPLAMLLVAAYYAVFTPASYYWGEALTAAGWANLLVVAFNMIINFITEFLFQRYVVFRNSIDTNSKKKNILKSGEKFSLSHKSINSIYSYVKNVKDDGDR